MLETKRLILKAHTMENFEKIDQWMNDPELLYFDDDEPEPYQRKSEETMRKIMDRFISATPEAEKEIIHLGIHTRYNDQLIGYCMIAFIDRYHKSCKFGLTIGDSENWGKGYGTEILNEMIRYSFEHLGMNRIGASVYSHNDRSLTLFKKCGFKEEGKVRQSVLKQGKFVDEYIFGLLKEEWSQK